MGLTVSRVVLLEKLSARGFGRCTDLRVKNWLGGQAQTVIVNGIQSGWQLVTRGVP